MKINTKHAIQQMGHIIDLWMPIKSAYDKTPGITIAIGHKGKLVYSKGFGFSDMTKKERASSKTLYHIASHSKMFTSMAIMKLVDEGKLRLDDYIANYIPWFKAKSKQSDSSKITIRQILAHTSGVFRDGDTDHWQSGNFPKDLQKSFSEKSLIVENGTNFKYTNYGYSLLGQVIEKVSGMSFAEYVQKKIFRPLKLNNTYVDYKSGIKNVATGYSADIPMRARKAFDHFAAESYAPATGFVSSAEDLVKFMNELSLHNNSRKILSREAVKEMIRPHANTGRESYCLGVELNYRNHVKYIGHGGGYSGFITKTILNTENDVCVVVLTNSFNSNAGRIAFGIHSALMTLARDSLLMAKNNRDRAKYEGLFRCTWGDVLVLTAGKKMFFCHPEVNNPFEDSTKLNPISPNKFIMKSEDLFDAYDEEAIFSDLKNGKFQNLNLGASPLKRINIKT